MPGMCSIILSRLGVRGEEVIGGGLSAIYQYEFGVDVTEGGNLNNNRPKWVGLKGTSLGLDHGRYPMDPVL
jgi:predicted porin